MAYGRPYNIILPVSDQFFHFRIATQKYRQKIDSILSGQERNSANSFTALNAFEANGGDGKDRSWCFGAL